MAFESDQQIEAIALAFLDRTLPKSAWTHAAHFASVMWLIVKRPDVDVTVAMPQFIRAYNAVTGTVNSETSGYHETITQASIRAARSFCNTAGDYSLAERCNMLMSSPLGKSGWILRHWSKELLFSPEARRAWVEPDLRPLPF
jgi:hypothetical protein